MILDEVSGQSFSSLVQEQSGPRAKKGRHGREGVMNKRTWGGRRGGGREWRPFQNQVIPSHCVKREGVGQPAGICGAPWCLGCPHKIGWNESQNTRILSNVFSVGRALLFPFQCPRSLKSESCPPPRLLGKRPNGSLEPVSENQHAYLWTSQF